jgi:hypothetical protein
MANIIFFFKKWANEINKRDAKNKISYEIKKYSKKILIYT